MGIQLYTREYTRVYTRVYSPLLGSRDTLRISTPRTQILLPCVCILLGYLAPSSIVISCGGSDTIGLESQIGAASCLASHKKEKRKRGPNDRESHRESLMDIPHKGERQKTPGQQRGWRKGLPAMPSYQRPDTRKPPSITSYISSIPRGQK